MRVKGGAFTLKNKFLNRPFKKISPDNNTFLFCWNTADNTCVMCILFGHIQINTKHQTIVEVLPVHDHFQ